VLGKFEGNAATVLFDFGNMSSPTALFALDRAVQAGASGPHLLVAFGPGFSARSISETRGARRARRPQA
jgi:predicted naringenin-chalcone synthase